MEVPFIDLKRYENGFLDAINVKIASLMKNAQFIAGDEVTRLEARLNDCLGVSHTVTCANGTDALQLALRAIGVGAGDTVLVPNVTFWATFEAVINVGAKPVTLDALISDGGVAYSALEEAIPRVKPKAAVIAHLYGWGAARLSEIRALCRAYGVLLVEDGAQCYGVTYRGDPIYKGALISTTSFYPTKVLGGAGDGGAVFTDDAELAENVRRLCNHGRTAHYGHGHVGWNSRLDSLQAVFLNQCLDNIDQRIASRRWAAAVYQQRLPELGMEVMLPPSDYQENGYCNVCLVRDLSLKSVLESELTSAGVGFGNIYPGVMSKQPGAAPYNLGHFGGDQGEVLSASVLNLPLFTYMTNEELDYVMSTVRNALERRVVDVG